MILLKKLLLLVLFTALILAQFISAIEVDFVDEIAVYENVKQTFNFTVNNTNSFPIYNVTLTGSEYINMSDFSVDTNTSKILNFTVLTNTSFMGNKILTLSYTFYTNQTTTPTTHLITLDNNFLSPNFVGTRIGDTVRFKNNHATATYTIKDINGTWQFTVPPNSQVDKIYTTEQQLHFYCVESGILADINVTTNEIRVLTHSPQNDKLFTIDFNSFHSHIGLEIKSYTQNISVNLTQQTEGAIELKTVNGSMAYGVKLSSDSGWITFNENDFDFSGTKIVIYKIKPTGIDETNQTNKTYEIVLKAKADNSVEVSDNVSVFLNYAQFIDTDYSNGTSMIFCTDEMIKAFCKLHPESCPTTNVTVIQFINVTDPYTEWLKTASEKLDRIYNKEDKKIDRMEDVVKLTENQSDQLSTLRDDIEWLKARQRTEEASSSWGWGLFAFLLVISFIGILGVVTFFKVKVWKRKRGL